MKLQTSNLFVGALFAEEEEKESEGVNEGRYKEEIPSKFSCTR